MHPVSLYSLRTTPTSISQHPCHSDSAASSFSRHSSSRPDDQRLGSLHFRFLVFLQRLVDQRHRRPSHLRRPRHFRKDAGGRPQLVQQDSLHRGSSALVQRGGADERSVRHRNLRRFGLGENDCGEEYHRRSGCALGLPSQHGFLL